MRLLRIVLRHQPNFLEAGQGASLNLAPPSPVGTCGSIEGSLQRELAWDVLKI